MRRALAIDEASYGRDHPIVATRLNNLALLLKATKRLDEVEPLLRRALGIVETSYGVEHPELATSLSNLASLLYDTKRLGEAEALMRRAVEVLVVGGPAGYQHPHLGRCVSSYAKLLRETGHNHEEVVAQLNALGRPHGVELGSSIS
jgi:hypothetical protein